MAFKLFELYGDIAVRGTDKVSSNLADAKRDVFAFAAATQSMNKTMRMDPITFQGQGKNKKTPEPEPTAFQKQYAQGTNYYAASLMSKAQKDLTKAVNETVEASKNLDKTDADTMGALGARRREAIRMQRILKTLGGAETGGSQFSEGMKRLAISKQEEGFFQRSQKFTLLRVAAMRDLSKATAGVLLFSGQVAEKLGKAGFFLTKLQEGTQAFTRTAAIGFTALTGGIMGFVTAGLRGTAEGARFGYLFQQISMQIAGIFMPAIRQVTKILEDVLQWFRNLTGEQQRSIAAWALTAATVLGVVFVLGQIVTVFGEIIVAIRAANAALATFLVLGTKGKAIALVAEALAVGVGVYYAQKKIGQALGGKAGDERTDVSQMGGTAESFQGTYARIQQAAAGVDSPIQIAKDQLTTLESIDNRLSNMGAGGMRFVPTPGMRP